MKNLNLDAYGVSEMSQQEMVNENGGWSLEGAVAGAACCWCLGPEGALLGFIVGGFLLDSAY
ncbi:hypothetical protein FACS1894181_10280 [Bacteroidia bacterium]|nr:hypothetical protein FACS1894181_10280 [Bacteroidia bacterium]